MDPPPKHVVRLMSPKDFDQVLAIWADTGMYQADDSLSTWMKIDPRGLYVASTDEGYILGMCCAVFSKDDLAFLGFYAVRKEYRGKGVGGGVFKAALDHLQGRNCALNTEAKHLLTYRDRAGFKLQTGWMSLASHVNYDPEFDQRLGKLDRNPNVNVVQINSDELMSRVVKFDEIIHGYNRELLLTLSLNEANSLAMVAMDRDNQVKGYGLIRKDVKGYAGLGPLYADDNATAENLTYELIQTYRKMFGDQLLGLVFMGLKSNPGSVAIIEKLNMNIDDRCERLFMREIVNIPDMSKIYGQHDLNFCSF